MVVFLTPSDRARIKEEVKLKVYDLKKDNKITEKKALDLVTSQENAKN